MISAEFLRPAVFVVVGTVLQIFLLFLFFFVYPDKIVCLCHHTDVWHIVEMFAISLQTATREISWSGIIN